MSEHPQPENDGKRRDGTDAPGPRMTIEQKTRLEQILEDILDGYPINPDVARHVMANFAAAVDYWCAPDLLTLCYTGSRTADREWVRDGLDVVLEREGAFRLLVGYNERTRQPRGGDRWTYEWAADKPQVEVRCFPAPWDVPEVKKAAGPYRNGHMVGLALGGGGRVGMLAHVVPGSQGAAGAAAYAQYAGVRVWRPEPAR